MQMVKEGMSIDEAIDRATALEKREKAQVRWASGSSCHCDSIFSGGGRREAWRHERGRSHTRGLTIAY